MHQKKKLFTVTCAEFQKKKKKKVLTAVDVYVFVRTVCKRQMLKFFFIPKKYKVDPVAAYSA